MARNVKLTIRLTVGMDDDLIVWLEGLDIPWGLKGQQVKDALRRGIGNQRRDNDQSDWTSLLAEIRRVAAAGVADALSGIQISHSSMVLNPERDEEAEDMLDQLGGVLLLGESAIEGRNRS